MEISAIYKMASDAKDDLQKACNRSQFVSVLSNGGTAKDFCLILNFMLFFKERLK